MRYSIQHNNTSNNTLSVAHGLRHAGGGVIAGIGASAPLRLIWAPPRSARDAYQRDYDPATLHRSA